MTWNCRAEHQLHSGFVHNHILTGDLGVPGCHLLAVLEEESITQFHDVGLAHGCHFLAPTLLVQFEEY